MIPLSIVAKAGVEGNQPATAEQIKTYIGNSPCRRAWLTEINNQRTVITVGDIESQQARRQCVALDEQAKAIHE
jgi:hypothetical protein